jgi:hypothetical protein
MTETEQNNQEQKNEQEQKNYDKEMNFRALESRYKRELDRVNEEKNQLQLKLQTYSAPIEQEEDDDSEPYVDHKKLNKKLSKFEQQTKQHTQQQIQEAVRQAKEEAKKEAFLEDNADFYETLKEGTTKLIQKAPALAKCILNMPENFERQKLVYQNIKELGLHKSDQQQSNVQTKINANQNAAYYQPSSVGTPNSQPVGDFSPAGKKAAYDYVQNLKNKLRI